MHTSKEQYTATNASVPQLELANITVGTADGPSVFYARSKRSIHQHAMKVSLRERKDSHDRLPTPAPVVSQTRGDLMTRFRANPSPPKKRGGSKKTKSKESSESDEIESISSSELTSLPPRLLTPTEYFPIDVGLDASYLNRLLETSLFGQVPYIVCPEQSPIEYAIQDPALLNGMLALASLGRDLDKDMRASTLCLNLKGKTIQAVRQRLLEEPHDISVGTIGAIASLAAFDLLECLGRNEPRPDNMTFLQLAVARKGGLHGLLKSVIDTSVQCTMIRRVILWLDLSFAIMDGTPMNFAFHDTPIHLASIALHNVSLHMTPLDIVFAELSNLSTSVDEGLPAGRDRDGDQVSEVEQYVANLRTDDLEQDVLEILRPTTFLYSARYVRQFSSNSRFQMQLAYRLQTYLGVHFQKVMKIRELGHGSETVSSCRSELYLPVIVWSMTVAAVSSGSFKEIGGRDQQERRSVWTKMIWNVLRTFEIDTITQVESMLEDMTHDTITCRKERRTLLMACSIPEV